jgi:alkyldihydroxyacetonephosphate synthase
MNNRTLRWYGWGYEDTHYRLEDHPGTLPYLQAQLGLAADECSPVVARESIQLRPNRLSAATLQQLRQIVGAEWVIISDAVRLTHSLGKSYRDLVRLRAGQIPNPTDGVVCPGSVAEVEQVLALAATQGLAVIPFGGGTSVVGGVEPLDVRVTLTLSLARLNRVLAVDTLSQTVTAEAGILGPDLEVALNAQGFTLGHFPQSFEFSTLGGWIATRSAGHASTKYGTIAAMVVALQMVTPTGIVETRPAPAAATGPSLLQLLIGSEGVYGIITRATLRIAPLPLATHERALLFGDFPQGLAAVRSIMQRGLTPALLRLSDETETRTGFAMRGRVAGWQQIKEKVGLSLLARAGRSFAQGALLLLRFTGEAQPVRLDDQQAQRIVKACGAYDLGGGPVRSWQRDRYRTPYLRDLLLDHGILIDTVETATEWENVAPLYEQIKHTLTAAIADSGSKPLVTTHLSHAYRDGASLYVTFLARRIPGQELEQWQQIKARVTECILTHGGALSHHHGVGSDHARWLPQEAGSVGSAALRAVKHTLDPQAIMNPTKLFPPPLVEK